MSIIKIFSIRDSVYGTKSSNFLRKMTPEELKKVQDCFFEMLKDFSDACEKHNITYMLSGGNVIGSVRHKGPIPWDNDVDILVPRKDMIRLLEVFDDALGDKYELSAPNSKYKTESIIGAIYKKGTYMPNIQTVGTDLPKGIHMDLFPVDYAPENALLRGIKGSISIVLQFIAISSLMRQYMTPEKTAFYCSSKMGRIKYNIRMFTAFIFSFIPYRKWVDMYDKVIRNKKETKLCTVAGDVGSYFNNIFPTDTLLPPSKGIYGDLQLNLPNDTDKYLTKLYGDYMTLPPESERLVHWIVDVDFSSSRN